MLLNTTTRRKYKRRVVSWRIVRGDFGLEDGLSRVDLGGSDVGHVGAARDKKVIMDIRPFKMVVYLMCSGRQG